jgi:hypothetical protein
MIEGGAQSSTDRKSGERVTAQQAHCPTTPDPREITANGCQLVANVRVSARKLARPKRFELLTPRFVD